MIVPKKSPMSNGETKRTREDSFMTDRVQQMMGTTDRNNKKENMNATSPIFSTLVKIGS